MAKFSIVKCWHISDVVFDLDSVGRTTPSFNILKKSILKHGYRGFAVEDREFVESQSWYKPFLQGEEVRFYIDGSGVYKLVNCDLTENELYFERLNVPVGHRPWIFYSWQSDYNPARSKIKDALVSSVDYINRNLSPRRPLEIIESTRPEDGAGDIVQAIKRNIDLSLFTIFDITNVSQIYDKQGLVKKESTQPTPIEKQKCYPNANVVFELSYSLCKKKADQVLLVKADRKGDFPDDSVPFDFDHNKRLMIESPSKLKMDLQEILIHYLRQRNFIQGEG